MLGMIEPFKQETPAPSIISLLCYVFPSFAVAHARESGQFQQLFDAIRFVFDSIATFLSQSIFLMFKIERSLIKAWINLTLTF